MGPKKQGFWPRTNCSQIKLLNFGPPSGDSSSKIGRHFSNKVVFKLKSAKNAFYQKGAPKLIFCNDFFFKRFRWFLKVQNWHFLKNCHLMETQRISFHLTTVDSWPKTLPKYAECRIMKFHYRNSSAIKHLLKNLV